MPLGAAEENTMAVETQHKWQNGETGRCLNLECDHERKLKDGTPMQRSSSWAPWTKEASIRKWDRGCLGKPSSRTTIPVECG